MTIQSSSRTRWIEAVAPDEPHKFERRLEWEELTENDFHAALNREPAFLDEDAACCQETLQDALEAVKAAWDWPLLPVDKNFKRPFVDLWWPIRCRSAENLRQAFPSDSARLKDDVFDQLADSLLDRLCSIGEQVLWEAFNAERSPGSILLAHLGTTGDGSGAPVREHYERFIQSHRRNGLAQLLQEFPVLRRLIGNVLYLWFQGSMEMLQRICADRKILQQRFAIPCTNHLATIRQGLSDPHCGGRAVAVLEFVDSEPSASDASIYVVYKPKNMGVEAAFQAALDDLNVHSDFTPLRTLAIHDGNGYGYMEYVDHRICANDIELANFYLNAGRLTALLHLLGCTDCHYENLIACGDQLLLIDAETLFEVDRLDHIREASSAIDQPEPSTLQKQLQSSVLRSGLLPKWMFLGESKEAIDISALGISPSKKPEEIAIGWLGFNSDGMMPGRVSQPVENLKSLPVGIGQNNPFDRFLENFCDGFSLQCEAFIKIRNRWLEANGILANFAGLQRRIVLRATRVYFAIQRQQLEPASLRSSLAQALKLEQLARYFLLAESKPHHWPIFAEEVRQMKHLDIPFFTHLIDSDSLDLDGLKKELPGFIQTSGLAASYKRLRNLDADEIAFQLRMIRGAAEARQLRMTFESSPPLEATTLTMSMSPSCETSLEAAKHIAQHLMKLAIIDSDGQVEWLGMVLGADGESFDFGTVGLSLYGGSIGIVHLLQRLQKQNVSLVDADAIQDAILKPLRAVVDQPSDDRRRRWWRDQPLGLNGCGGILLALELLGDQAMTSELLVAVKPRFIEADQQLDVIGGCAGLIGSLLRLGTESALQLALHAGDHLITQQSEHGAWSSSLSQSGLLCFSHGVAGCAAALARLHTFTDEDRYYTSAMSALAYERARFNNENGNWPDYRTIYNNHDSKRSDFMASCWCHGAPGIALSRACLWGTALWDEQCAKEIEVGLLTTASKDLQMDNLCCGSLGLMVLLEMLSSGPWPINDQIRSHCQEVAVHYRLQALHRCSAEQIELRCFSTSKGLLVLPGFFTGLSGMGLALLEDDQSRAVISQLISAGLWPAQ